MRYKLFSLTIPFLLFFNLFPGLFSLATRSPKGEVWPLPENQPQEQVLAQHTLDLTNRIKGPYANEVFRKNILLNVQYFHKEIDLKPGEIFAFHDQLLPEYKNKTVKTHWTHFSTKEGYQALAGLVADGVCHLASLMNWTAQDAGLTVYAPARHDFFPVNGVPRQYGTSIYYQPDGGWRTLYQNLYITNNFDYPIKLVFETTNDVVNLRVIR